MEYTILIHKDEKSGWYCGQCEQLPGAISQGATYEELMENMKEAISLIWSTTRKKPARISRANEFFTES